MTTSASSNTTTKAFIVLLALVLGLPSIYGVVQLSNLNFSPLKQQTFLSNCVALFIICFFVFRRVDKKIHLIESKIKSSVIIAIASFVIAFGGLFLANKLVVTKTLDRTAIVVSKSLASRLHANSERASKRPPIHLVGVPSSVNEKLIVNAIVDPALWQQIQPGTTKVDIRTDIGLTGVESATVLTIGEP